MNTVYKEYCEHIDNLITNESIATELKIIGEYINCGPINRVIGLTLGQLVTDISHLERQIAKLKKDLEECAREPKVIAVDFDGTLCEDNWPGIGAPKTDMIEYLKERKMRGDKLILWTCRSGDLLDDAVDWCLDQGLMFDAVNDNLPELVERYGSNSRKIFADEYIDDRNFDFHNNFIMKENKDVR